MDEEEIDGVKSPIKRLGSTRKLLVFNSELLFLPLFYRYLLFRVKMLRSFFFVGDRFGFFLSVRDVLSFFILSSAAVRLFEFVSKVAIVSKVEVVS